MRSPPPRCDGQAPCYTAGGKGRTKVAARGQGADLKTPRMGRGHDYARRFCGAKVSLSRALKPRRIAASSDTHSGPGCPTTALDPTRSRTKERAAAQCAAIDRACADIEGDGACLGYSDSCSRAQQ